MRAAAYLSHALVLRRDHTALHTTPCSQTLTQTVTVHARAPQAPIPSGTSPAPDSATCVAGKGIPGSVYFCGTPGDCEHWDYSKVKDCQALGATFQRPSLVVPDFGGHCHLYSATTCADADEIKLIDAPNAPLPVPSKPAKITCPGIRTENIPATGAVAIKCINSLEHPTAPGSSPAAAPPAGAPLAGASLAGSSPAPSPSAAPAPPASTCPPPPTLLANLKTTLPKPDPCTCNAAIGHPGAVYLCKKDAKTPTTDCKWFDYPAVKDCQPLNALEGMDFTGVSFVGPDFGGHCHLYLKPSCDDASEVTLFINEKGEPSKKFVCPGVNLPYVFTSGDQTPDKLQDLFTAKYIMCVDSMVHPTVVAPAAT